MGQSFNISKHFIGLIFILFFIISNSCRRESFSPSQADSFIKFFGSNNIDEGIDVKSLPGGGYVLVGTTTTGGFTDITLIITDKYGNEAGTPKIFGGSFDDRVYSLRVLSDGGFAILGSTAVEGPGQSLITDMYLIRTDSQGNEIWSRRYGGNSNEIGYGLAETSDGGFILIGSTENLGTGYKNIYLVKTNSEGSTVWTQIHGGIYDDAGFDVTETDDGYIYTGYTRSFFHSGQSNSNIFIVKTNSLGRVIFPFTYGSNGDDFGKSLIHHPDGGYVVLGTTTNGATDIKNIFLSHINEDISRPEWTKSIGESISHDAASMKITSEGNYIITGTQELTPENHVIFLLKSDPNGNQIFFRTFGGSGFQRAHAVDIAEDGGYIITGSNQFGGNSMITLIKTDADGEL